IGIVDAYCAMITDRPYRKALTQEGAIAELKKCAGTQFDPELVDKFIKCLKERKF
ncbi:MAG: phosphohydrolase, partial [Syntrophobacter sp. DG_60]